MSDVLTKYEEYIAVGNVYGLLGRLWVQELDESLLSKFQAEPLRSAFVAISGDELPTESLDDLAAEYCRLFVGPQNHFPPIQSVWQEGKLDSEIGASVRSFAEAIGYEPSSDYPHTLMDHLGIELEIMSRTLHSIAGQIADGRSADETQAFAREFFRRHLCWTDRLIAAAIRSAELGFYRSLLANTQDFLDAEKDFWISSVTIEHVTRPTPTANRCE